MKDEDEDHSDEPEPEPEPEQQKHPIPIFPSEYQIRSESTVLSTQVMMVMEQRSLWFWIVALVTLASAAAVSSIDHKCAACTAVAAELEIGLSNEKPKNDLDMRYRLNSKGQREGKLIDYRVSELRVVDLLDGLCDKMLDYTLDQLDSGKEGWIKVRNWDTLKTDKQAAKAHSKAISTFCGRLLDETEDELSERIKAGSIQVGGVSKALCHDLTKYCASHGHGHGHRNSNRHDDGEL